MAISMACSAALRLRDTAREHCDYSNQARRTHGGTASAHETRNTRLSDLDLHRFRVAARAAVLRNFGCQVDLAGMWVAVVADRFAISCGTLACVSHVGVSHVGKSRVQPVDSGLRTIGTPLQIADHRQGRAQRH